MAAMASVVRILLIEDTPSRVETIRRWLPPSIEREGRRVPVVLVHAPSAGLALGMVARARRGEWAGIMLDHDLDTGARTSEDHERNGRDVGRALIARTAALGSLRILVHSMSPIAGAMAAELAQAGHAVDQAPFETLEEARFAEWFACVAEEWEPA